MGKKILILSIIIGALILIGLISSFSYWLGQKSVEVKPEITVPSLLKSKVIRDWSAMAVGEVIEISNHTLTLSSNEETLVIPILKEAKINSLSLEEGEKKLENIQFEDIKVGDNVDIRLGVTPEGNVVGNFVTVLH